jgi:hypothetical protein
VYELLAVILGGRYEFYGSGGNDLDAGGAVAAGSTLGVYVAKVPS